MTVIDSSSWTGLPSHVRLSTGPYGEILSEAQDEEMFREYRREQWLQRRGALAMLWGPPIIDRDSTRRRTDGIIDYSRQRGEEWTFWRAVVATIAIIFNRMHGRRQEVLHKRRTGRSYIPSLDLGYWDAFSDGYGCSSMGCQLYPGARVEIFSDGESWL